MNMRYFLHRYSPVLFNSDGDNYFATIKVVTGGTTSARMAKVINFASSLLSQNECYLEVGVYTGFTLCSAGFMNMSNCVGIDNFDMESVGSVHPEPDIVRGHCKTNISILAPRAKLIESDFRNVTAEQIGLPVGVSFIDGRHELKDVLDNLEWLEPKLADEAILIFDDVGLGAVNGAIRIWEADHLKNYDIVALARPHYIDPSGMTRVQDEVIHQGICIMRYNRNGFQ